MIRKKIDLWLTNLGIFAFEKRWLVIITSLLLIGGMVMQLPKLQVDTSAEGLLHKKDPALVTYENFRKQFGLDHFIMIAMDPPEIFEPGFLKKLRSFHKELELVKNVDDITSLINIDSIRGENDDLIVEGLLDNFPEDIDALSELKKQIIKNPLYRNTIISADGKVTLLVITPKAFTAPENTDTEIPETLGGNNKFTEKHLSEKDMGKLVDAIQIICDKYSDEKFPIHLGGSAVAEEMLKRMTNSTMFRFTAIMTILILIILAIFFRRVSGVFLPLVIVDLSLVVTFGLMAIFGSPITLNTTILPSFLLAVGIGDSIHLLTIFYRQFNLTNDKKGSLSFALSHSGLALIMTSLTTASGLLSFTTSGIAPIAELGMFSAIGVMFALLFTLTLLPALLAVVPVKNKGVSSSMDGKIDNFISKIADFATSYPKQIVIFSALLGVISLAGALTLRFTHNSLLYFPEDNKVRQSIALIDEHFNGSINVEILVDTGKKYGLYDPDVMNLLDSTNRYSEKIIIDGRTIGKATSAVDMLKEVNQALHEGRPEYYSVPDSRELIAQEFLLYEMGGGDDLRKKVDSDYSKARITLMAPWVDAVKYTDVIRDFEEHLKLNFKGLAKVTVTGMTSIICKTLTEVIRSMGKSYLIACIVITFFMILMIGSFKIGLLSMIPNLLPIIVALGFMRLVGIPLDYSTILVGSIAIGLVVDDTVHFFHHFTRNFKETNDVKESVHMAFKTAGRAMIFTTIILGTGFFICVFAELNSTSNFGIITGFSIVMALLADFLLSPALMILVTKKNTTGKLKSENCGG